MDTLNNYNVITISSERSISKIDLLTTALGGIDAMNFNNSIDAVVHNGTKILLINLEKVELMNSTGLGMLVSAHNTLKKQNISLYLISVPDKVTKLLEITHLNKIFKTFSSQDEALNNL